MDVRAFLADLHRRGVHVAADGGELVVDGAESMTDADRAFIREHKAEILAGLEGGRPTTRSQTSSPAAAAPVRRASRPARATGQRPSTRDATGRFTPTVSTPAPEHSAPIQQPAAPAVPPAPRQSWWDRIMYGSGPDEEEGDE